MRTTLISILFFGLVSVMSLVVRAEEALPPKILSEELPITKEAATVKLLPKEDIKAEVFTESKPVVIVAPKVESQIPVLVTNEKKSDPAESPWSRMIFMLITISVIGMGAILFLKRASLKMSKQSDLMQIKLLTQFHLGPKKSLAVIRVAGESMLIGLTDHNISMLKTLTLMDDELPEVTPKDFRSVLTSESPAEPSPKESSEDGGEVEDEFAMQRIKDMVKTRVKGLRRFY